MIVRVYQKTKSVSDDADFVFEYMCADVNIFVLLEEAAHPSVYQSCSRLVEEFSSFLGVVCMSVVLDRLGSVIEVSWSSELREGQGRPQHPPHRCLSSPMKDSSTGL